MAEQKSRLVLEIDSRDAEQKAADVRKALSALEDAGIRVKPAMDKAGAGIDGFGKASTKAGESLGQLGKSVDGSAKSTASISESYAAASTRLLAMATSSLQASDYVKALSASTTSASVSFDAASDKIRSITSLSARFRAESDALAGSTDKASTSTRNASVATDLQKKELAELLAKINPAVAALNRLDDMQSKLGRFQKAGLIDPETFKDYSTRLDSTRQGLSAFDEGLSKTGISAKQTESALRQLPMQFSDIFTSLAAGQNPLLVLLQQGSQIKDSFGGIGNTVDVLGGKVKGFFSSIAGSSAGIAGAGAALGELASQQNAVSESTEAAADGLGGMADSANTATDAAKNAKEAAAALGAGASGAGISVLAMVGAATAAAAAIGLLIYAYNKGSKEADAYNNALILTGNYAGTTAADLGAMAKRVGSSTTTVADAAAALAILAESAKIPVAQFEMISTTALQMEDATGKAIRETIAEFEKIADSPTKAIAALNEKYGFLTASVYEQIRALEQQGDKQAAAVIAEDAYSAALDTRSEQIKKNLGTIERAWDDVTSAAKSGWDAIFDIGRQDVSGPDVTKIQQKINYLKSTLGSGYEDAGAQAQINALQAQIDAVNKINIAARDRAAAEGEATRVQREGLAAYEKFQQSIAANASKAQKRDKALKDAQDEINKSRLAGYKITTEQEAAALKAIRDNPSYKDAKTPAPKPYTEDAGQKMLDQARQQFAVLQQQNSLIGLQKGEVDKLGASGQALIKWEQQLADIKGKKTLTADQKSLLASQDLITAQLKKNAAIEKESDLRKTAADEIRQSQQDQVKLLTLTGQLRAANSLKSSLDDAAQLAEYERQGNFEAVKRLETMIKIRDVNLQASLKPGTVEGVSEAPQIGGLDTSAGGAYGEIKRLNDEAAKVDAWRTVELEKQKAYLDLKAVNESTYAERVANINKQSRDSLTKIEAAKNSAVITSSADFFGNMATLSQSGNKKLGEVGKAAAIAQATMQGYVAVQNALAVQPYPVGMALAVSAGVVAAANVASIAGIGFSGGGYTGPGGVNEVAGTVHKGEVVWSQKDIQRYGGVAAVESLRNGNVSVMPSSASGGSVRPTSSTAPQINITIHADGTASTDATAGYEERAMVIARAVLAAEGPDLVRSGIMREKGQHGLLDPSNRRNAG